MRQYLFTVCLFLLLLICAAGVYPSVHDIHFLNTGYKLHKKYIPQLIEFSQKHDIRIETLQNWIMAESSGREKAYNKKSRDYGLCQLHDVDYLVGKHWTGGKFDKYNGEHNLFIGLAYLSDLIKDFGIYHGFMAYNIGRSRVARGEILQDGIEYVNRIFPEQMEKGSVVYFGDNGRMVLTFREQELYDKRGLRA